MPPAPTGVATCSAELVSALCAEHEIDVFAESAHDFLWRHRLRPYDLTVYQLGNSSWHDYMWPYLFRFPGLVVLHDAHLHHARAAALLRARRADDYRQEFMAAHPDVSADLAELAVAGFDTHLYYSWPLTRLVVETSRFTAVHSASLAETLREDSPQAPIEAIHLGHGRRIGTEEAARASVRVRERHGISPSAIVFGLFGGLTPEKRVPQVLDAFAALLPYHPDARLLLVGAPARHYDVVADITRLGITENTTVVGYVEDDELFDEYVAGCDVSINLRWPTAREVSGPWLRALAAGRPTITTDLAHMADVPALDPRTWRLHQAVAGHTPEPVTVGIDILDEDHSLRLAMRRLAVDKDLRATLGAAGAAYWSENGSVERMVADYRRVIARGLESPIPSCELPAHLRADGSARLAALLEPFGLPADVWSRI
jgi:glycosyltransferase involved in cell wall biosynthesis